MKIPYVMDESLSWEERYRQLEKHHLEETAWMMAHSYELTKEHAQEKIRADIAERTLSNLCKIVGLSVGAAHCLPDGPPELTKEIMEHAQKVIREIDQGGPDESK